MAKTAYINARVDKSLKTKAEKVLKSIGVNTTDLVEMTLHQVVLQQGVPFEVRIPNQGTREAIRELEAGGGKKFDSVEALFADALGKSWRSKIKKH